MPLLYLCVRSSLDRFLVLPLNVCPYRKIANSLSFVTAELFHPTTWSQRLPPLSWILPEPDILPNNHFLLTPSAAASHSISSLVSPSSSCLFQLLRKVYQWITELTLPLWSNRDTKRDCEVYTHLCSCISRFSGTLAEFRQKPECFLMLAAWVRGYNSDFHLSYLFHARFWTKKPLANVYFSSIYASYTLQPPQPPPQPSENFWRSQKRGM